MIQVKVPHLDGAHSRLSIYSEVAVVGNARGKPAHEFDSPPLLCAETPVSTAAMLRVLEEKMRLCDVLEEIADSLPDSLDKARCLQVASILVPIVRSTHGYEENVIFPAYISSLPTGKEPPSLARLRAEHFEDECYADELTEALLAIARGGKVGNADALGYMLRAFFESVRRHVAFEREHIIPSIESGWK